MLGENHTQASSFCHLIKRSGMPHPVHWLSNTTSPPTSSLWYIVYKWQWSNHVSEYSSVFHISDTNTRLDAVQSFTSDYCTVDGV